MSRCFPFPPPGYEKKITTDELDLLKKEKRKEKKHKKDKKDKEKKDGKEKREKDRSEGKHKDKKDKRRDKKKDKDKNSTPDEKKVYGQFEGYNGEKLHHKDEETKEKSSSSNDKKPSLQFQNGEYNEQFQKKEFFQPSTQFRGENGDLVRNRINVGDTENSKFVQELDRRVRNEEKGIGCHQFVVEGRKNSFNKVEIRKTDETGFGRNAAIQNKINGATPPSLDTKIEQKEKTQEKGSDDKRGDSKRKNKDKDKERHGKDKDKKEKSEKRKAERDKKKHIKNDSIATLNNLSKRKNMETNGVSHENEPRPNKMARHISNISPENGRTVDYLHSPGSSLLDKQQASQGSMGQRVNGMIASQPIPGSAKKPPVSSFNHVPIKPSPIKSPPVITNHVAAQLPPLSSTPPPPPPVPRPPVSRAKPPPTVVNKVAAPPPPPPPSLPIPKKKPPAATESSMKPPHPDAKYLNQILAVPKLEQWVGFDNQEWLFSSKAGPSSKKTTMEELQVQVWSEAKHIESVDVCALPYVIPY